MKRFVLLMVLTFMAATASPCYSFLDYLFGGAHTRDSIDNSAVGDLRAWWSGNPVYQFNPYYSGSPNPAQQGGNMPPGQPLDQQRYSPPFGGGQDYQPQQQANVTFIPPQQQQYGYGAYQP
ncbi:MAG: hypothetical protein FJY85_06540, partial [Deltaproteobacteria bacterium]|nr:hypothetical protein [Deltaproteobacteria bacterium]